MATLEPTSQRFLVALRPRIVAKPPFAVAGIASNGRAFLDAAGLQAEPCMTAVKFVRRLRSTLESQFSEENRRACIAVQVNRKTKLAPLMFLLKSQTLRQCFFIGKTEKRTGRVKKHGTERGQDEPVLPFQTPLSYPVAHALAFCFSDFNTPMPGRLR